SVGWSPLMSEILEGRRREGAAGASGLSRSVTTHSPHPKGQFTRFPFRNSSLLRLPEMERGRSDWRDSGTGPVRVAHSGPRQGVCDPAPTRSAFSYPGKAALVCEG